MDLIPHTEWSRVPSTFGRLIESNSEAISEDLGHFFSTLTFSDDDKARMHELAEKNREGILTSEELEELDAYILAGNHLNLTPPSDAHETPAHGASPAPPYSAPCEP
jgi:hypothetical protein